MKRLTAPTARPRAPWLSPAALVCALALLMAGCAGLTRPYPEKLAYVLAASRPDTPPNSTTPGTILKVRVFRADTRFVGQKQVLLTSDGTWKNDYYNEWFVPPSGMIAEATQRWLNDSGLFGQVVPPASTVAATHLLEGNITELYGDFSDPAAPRATLGIDLLLLDDRALDESSRIVFHRRYRHETPLADRSPRLLAEGLDAALAAILTDFETDLKAIDLELPKPAESAATDAPTPDNAGPASER